MMENFVSGVESLFNLNTSFNETGQARPRGRGFLDCARSGWEHVVRAFRESCSLEAFNCFGGLKASSDEVCTSENRQSDKLVKGSNDSIARASAEEFLPDGLEALPPNLPPLFKISGQLKRTIDAYRKTEGNLERVRNQFKNLPKENVSTGDDIGRLKEGLSRAETKSEYVTRQLKLVVGELKADAIDAVKRLIADAEQNAIAAEEAAIKQKQVVRTMQDPMTAPWDISLSPLAEHPLMTEAKHELAKAQDEVSQAKCKLEKLSDERLIVSTYDDINEAPHVFDVFRSFVDDPEFELMYEEMRLKTLEEALSRAQARVDFFDRKGDGALDIFKRSEAIYQVTKLTMSIAKQSSLVIEIRLSMSE